MKKKTRSTTGSPDVSQDPKPATTNSPVSDPRRMRTVLDGIETVNSFSGDYEGEEFVEVWGGIALRSHEVALGTVEEHDREIDRSLSKSSSTYRRTFLGPNFILYYLNFNDPDLSPMWITLQRDDEKHVRIIAFTFDAKMYNTYGWKTMRPRRVSYDVVVRRKKVAELSKEGRTYKQIAAILAEDEINASLATIKKDRQATGVAYPRRRNAKK